MFQTISIQTFSQYPIYTRKALMGCGSIAAKVKTGEGILPMMSSHIKLDEVNIKKHDNSDLILYPYYRSRENFLCIKQSLVSLWMLLNLDLHPTSASE